MCLNNERTAADCSEYRALYCFTHSVFSAFCSSFYEYSITVLLVLAYKKVILHLCVIGMCLKVLYVGVSENNLFGRLSLSVSQCELVKTALPHFYRSTKRNKYSK